MTILPIHRKPSYRLAIMLGLSHFAAAGILWPLMLPLGIKIIVIVMLIISLVYYLRQDALLAADNAVVVVELLDGIQCMLITRSGESMACSILSSTFVAPYLTVLNLQPVGKFFVRSIVILPGAVDAEEFRQLRVWLRWKCNDRIRLTE